MEPRRRPIGMPMEMMKAVVDYQLGEGPTPFEPVEKQIEIAKKRIRQREIRVEKITNNVMEQLEKVEKFGEIEDALNEMGAKNPFMAIEIQIPNATQALEEQKAMYGLAVKSLEVTRGQLKNKREEYSELNNNLQNLQQRLKAKNKQGLPFLDELGKKAGAYAAEPNHQRYDKYRNQSSYERSRI